MFASYVILPQHRSPELVQKIQVVRPFVRDRQPYLHQALHETRPAHRQAITTHALRHDEDSDRLCEVLTSTLAEDVLMVLAWEFPMPGMKLLVELLPTAAQTLCAERQRNNAVALGLVGVGLLMVGAALSNNTGDKQPRR